MQWENLTSLDFVNAVEQCQGVGIIPIGVIEAHSSQLPLGTDIFTAHWTACHAAEQESAIVFPAYPYSINHETAHLPGGLVIKRDIAFALLENICDEMYRNGLTKIILLSGHGGNRYFLPLFVQTLPEKQKPYMVYYADIHTSPSAEVVLETEEYGHAGELETSMILHIAPDLVNLEQAPPQPAANLHRHQAVADAGGYSQIAWFAMYPHMYVGDARVATAKKGKVLLDDLTNSLVALIQAVKADTVGPNLVDEFNRRQDKPTPPEFWTQG
ncbi:creatininase family protein [Anaerolineales bacterium HSG6]|nr:creatininase family protein [Anaerolineales bacterium HSG6]